jgi:hypothetical protein
MVGEESLKNMSVRIDRIREDILQLASIGRSETDHGIYRMAFTQADMEARDWLEKKMQGAGLTTRRDGAANVCGELKAESGAPRVIRGIAHRHRALRGDFGRHGGGDCRARVPESRSGGWLTG